MARARMLLVQNAHPQAFASLREGEIEVTALSPGARPAEIAAALRALPGDEPLLIGVRSKTQITREVMEACPRLAGVGAFCIGTDQIDLDAAADLGIAVFNAPFSNTRSVAELVLGEMIMLVRQIMPKNRAAHLGRWNKTARGAHELRGKRLGIVGYGHIGSQLSILAEGLGLSVAFYDVQPKLPLGNARRFESYEELIQYSDILTFHVPDTPKTRNMLDAARLTLLRPGAWVINASRGSVVDLEALASALKSGAVAGAAVDVYPHEPKSNEDPFSCPLQGLDQVILTPHIGGSTQEAQEKIGQEVSQSLIGYIQKGSTSRNHALPSLDLPNLEAPMRLVNVHRNITGAASAINGVFANRGINIQAQQLGTRGNMGMMSVDFESGPEFDLRGLINEISELSASVRSRVISK